MRTRTKISGEAAEALLPGDILERAFTTNRRVLLIGQPGTGKSTLAATLALAFQAQGRRCRCIGADPGSPRFGVPGAVCLAHWQDGWQVTGMEALCTLDAARFRLPLVDAVRHLAHAVTADTLLIDAPGVVRGVAGAELLSALAEATATDLVLALVHEGGKSPLAAELRALHAEVLWVRADAAASRPGKRPRARERTRLWDAWLQAAGEQVIDLARVTPTGTPPPLDRPQAWRGRQVALLAAGRTQVVGEALSLDGSLLRIKAPPWSGQVDALLVRDAQRSADGYLNTAKPFASATLTCLPPPDVMPCQGGGVAAGPRPLVRLGVADALLVNGVEGDPLLHLRLRHQRRSLLFDLGLPEQRLSARIAHQVTDVFISHAHIDHIGGFLWLLRARMGEFPACRLYGPPGLAANIQGLLNGVHWDRIGESGPQFEVTELHGDRRLRFLLQAGRTSPQPLGSGAAVQGVLLDESAFRVRAVTLDHRTPVLAYAFEPPVQIGIRKQRLKAHGWPPGPWLGVLKRHLLEGQSDSLVTLPDGTTQPTGRLADALTVVQPGRKLVYATDLGDTPENRRRLVQLAQGSHTLFCEAPFAEADSGQARLTGHLTTRACGEIATAADVGQLIAFHFSRRYSGDHALLYAELAAACSRVVLPIPEPG